MKSLYLECNAGISGDMLVAALLDLGADKEALDKALQSIPAKGFEYKISRVSKAGVDCCDFDVILDEEHANHDHDMAFLHGNGDAVVYSHEHEHHHDHEHHHHHEHRNLKDVFDVIDNSGISEGAKELSKKIFMRVAMAESKVHNEPLDKVHFHEVGAIDSIVDIIGTAICIDMLKPDRIFSSVVNDGHGFIMCQHGQIPVPVPATAQIFADSDVISRQIDIDTELVTPTGAAIIAELAESYGAMPAMSVKKIGYGAGKKDVKIPNITEIFPKNA